MSWNNKEEIDLHLFIVCYGGLIPNGVIGLFH